MGWTRLMVFDDTLPMIWFRIVLPYGASVETANKIEADIVDAWNSDHSLVRKFCAEGLYGEHVYSHPVLGTESTLKAITLDDAEPPLPAIGPMGRTVWLVDKPERTQTQIMLGHLFERPEGEVHAGVWLANEAFGGGGFGARLGRHRRREDHPRRG